MKKNEIKKAIENAAATIENDEVYVESISNALGLNPEYAGVFVENYDGEIKAYIDDGCCYPAKFDAAKFAEIYGE